MLLGICDLSLGGSTEPPEPPLDLPQRKQGQWHLEVVHCFTDNGLLESEGKDLLPRIFFTGLGILKIAGPWTGLLPTSLG